MGEGFFHPPAEQALVLRICAVQVQRAVASNTITLKADGVHRKPFPAGHCPWGLKSTWGDKKGIFKSCGIFAFQPPIRLRVAGLL